MVLLAKALDQRDEVVLVEPRMFLDVGNSICAVEYCLHGLPVPIHRPEQYMIEDYFSLGKVFPEHLPLLLPQQ